MHVGTREQDVKLGDKRVATGNFTRISTVDIIFFFYKSTVRKNDLMRIRTRRLGEIVVEHFIHLL